LKFIKLSNPELKIYIWVYQCSSRWDTEINSA
jgi:hypothetical protein